ncbi:MAG: hypothetical protein RIC81_09305 [Microcella pacifica]|uniref:hypothetical protein n=1 Tax=Microcella pacifica TaxID=2591847 RepID=UPI003315E007
MGLILTVVLAVVAVGAVNQAALETARHAYAAALQDLDDATNDRQDALQAAQVLLDATTADDVDDPVLLDQLAELVAAAPELSSIVALDLESATDPAVIDAERSSLESFLDAVRSEVDAIVAAITGVEESRATQELSIAMADLEAAITEGDAALAESDGRVSDESVRSALGSALDAAREIRASSSATPETMRNEAASVRSAVAAVVDARVPVFTDVNGTWCYWENNSFCVTITLPRVGDDSVNQKPGADSYYPSRGDGWTYVVPGEPCFTTVVGDASGDPMGSAVFYFCPRGVSSSDRFQNYNNAQFDRIYISQQGAIDPYFRQSEWGAAVGR